MSEPRAPRSDDEASQPLELPPLPDGGLGSNMPAWLRRAPAFVVESTPDPVVSPSVTSEPSSLTAGLELPAWLDDLSRRVDRQSSVQLTIRQPEAIQPKDDSPELPTKPERVPSPMVTEPVVVPRLVEAQTAAERREDLRVERAEPDEPMVEPPYGLVALVVLVVLVALLLIGVASLSG